MPTLHSRGRRFAIIASLLVFTSLSCSHRHKPNGPPTSGSPFPGQGIDVFKSVFVAEIEIIAGPQAGTRIKLENLVDSAQSVARGEPFIDRQRVNDSSSFKLPAGYSLPTTVRDSDFPSIPDGFDGTGQEAIHLQITSLDAKSPDGRFRILAGQPLKKEFPQLFRPAYGMVVSDGGRGFPARSFFVPYSVIVTPHGNLISNDDRFIVPIFAQQPITQLPPYGASYAVTGNELLLSADNPAGAPVAKIVSLVHNVDLPGITDRTSWDRQLQPLIARQLDFMLGLRWSKYKSKTK